MTHLRQIKISVIRRKSGRTISIPVWFVLEGENLYLLPVQGSETQWYKHVLHNPLRRTGTLAFAIGFHAAFDLANLFVWSGQNAGEYAIGHLLETHWQGSQWLTGGLLGPEASWMMFVVIALMFGIFHRCYRHKKFPLSSPNV